MHDFGKLVYLDLHKTGSTFTSNFLNETCTLPLVREIKHGRVGPQDYDEDAFYFISIRHPEAFYRSLFRYGLDKRGVVYRRLKKARLSWLYRDTNEAYNRWLAFMLNRFNSIFLGERFMTTAFRYDLGFFSYRFLRLTLIDPARTLKAAFRTSNPVEAIKQAQIHRYVIRNEELSDGLQHLANTILPGYFDQEKVQRFIQQSPRINASKGGKATDYTLNDEVRSLLERKEKLLMEYYRQADPARMAAA